MRYLTKRYIGEYDHQSGKYSFFYNLIWTGVGGEQIRDVLRGAFSIAKQAAYVM